MHQILACIDQTLVDSLLQWSDRSRSDTAKKNKSKYYKFHRDHGHDTADCRDLKDQIESLVQRGYLKEFVGEGTESGCCRRKYHGRKAQSKPKSQKNDERPPAILTISGGLAGGESSNKQKTLARQAQGKPGTPEVLIVKLANPVPTVTFKDKEADSHLQPHNDVHVVVSTTFQCTECWWTEGVRLTSFSKGVAHTQVGRYEIQ